MSGVVCLLLVGGVVSILGGSLFRYYGRPRPTDGETVTYLAEAWRLSGTLFLWLGVLALAAGVSALAVSVTAELLQ